MKKLILYIIATILIVIITVAGTYAYFVTTTNSGNALKGSSSKLDVIYSGDADITGVLNLVSSKEEGIKSTVKIELSNDSVDAKANIYIQVNQIGQDIASDALNWELYRTYQGTESFVAKGTFAGVTAGDKIYIDRDYRLSTNETSYTVYIWLDGNKIGNAALGEIIKGYVGAEAEHITELK
jgi:hypothetical protein